ncbi:unnamed protein product [Pedinophyceae sp. YPF-701]|nr:unnamed protein product [Pedinophyceae sp. YPF-701]
MSREDIENEAVRVFQGIGLAESVAKNAAKNKQFRAALMEVIKESGLENGCPKSQGMMVYTIASKFPPSVLVHRKWVVDNYVLTDKICSNNQLDAAMAYLKKAGGEAKIDVPAFEEASGVGVVVTPEQIRDAVAGALQGANLTKLTTERYLCNTNVFLGPIMASVKWAAPQDVKDELAKQVAAILGPKTAADEAAIAEAKAGGKKGKKKAVAAAAGAQDAPGASPKAAKKKPEEPVSTEGLGDAATGDQDPFAFLPPPADNHYVHTTVNFSDGRPPLRVANTQQELDAHLRRTGGKYVTRFPPEPNGYLHIGHAKAMFIDFGAAARYDGHCFLRFDDTNPEAEKQEFIDHIQDIVQWMGWKPWKVTHASYYFQQLYELAVKLIKVGKAFVCHQTAEQVKEYREKRLPSPYRERPVEENLRLFEDMRRGLFPEGGAVLRMKQDVANENYNMFDLIAYRIKYVEHPIAGDEWCIYPSYDFTHCVCDAIEDITHSLCTLEFEPRRASYYWLLDALDMYKPCVWEYSRMNISNTVLSKRKLHKLVHDKHVRGWDDPRLFTLAGLRRRGATADGINAFCRDVGFSRNENTIHQHRLDHFLRNDLDRIAPRRMCVLDPVKLVLENSREPLPCECRCFPPGRTGPHAQDTYALSLGREVWIERSDFKEADVKGYFGLAPGKSVMLRYGHVVTCTGFDRAPDGSVAAIRAEVHASWEGKPPKGVIHWVPCEGAVPLEARLYDSLFKSEDPNECEDWIADLNPESEVVKVGWAPAMLADAQVGDKFQFERVGYFCIDPDSSRRRVVANRTVTLKDSYKK